MKQRALAIAIRRIIWAELALSTAIAVPAFAQSQPATPAAAASGTAAAAAPAAASGATATGGKNVKQLQTFQVTGSLIRQADKTGFNQVQVINSKEIQDSGAKDVSDYMRQISANSANSWGESTSDSFAAGGSGIALRGLSEKYTLVLVDGQRVAPFAFAVNGSDQFFDLNTLPLNVVDRIEVVKTGAVSQYGSDAIGGVVNIITKHDFQGLQLDGSIGGATQGGGGTTKFGVLGGFGNLASDGFNVTATASYYKSNGYTLADRDTTENQDFSNKPFGGSIQQPSYLLNPNTGAATPYGCATSVPAGNSIIASQTGAISSGNVCLKNTAEDVSIEPMTERLNAKVHADFKINDTTTAYADLWESNNTTTTNDGPVVVGNGLAYSPTTKTVSPLSFTVPANNPYNTTGVAQELFGYLPTTYSSTTDSNFWRAAMGLKGSYELGKQDWDWNVGYTHSMSTVSNTLGSVINPNALQTALNNGTLNFVNPSATPGALNSILTTADNLGISKLDAFDATLATPNLFHLPTGDVGLGLGAQFLHESELIEEGGNYLSGNVLNPNLQEVAGERNVAAVYYQVDVPLIDKMLTFSQSGRYDHYSDFGGAFSPRFALRFQPIQQLTTYASYTRGFRAPEFLENTNSSNIGIMPIGPNGQDENVITKGNPDLQPERTKNYNIGFELSPTRTTDIGFDWYKIHVDKAIGTQLDPSATVFNADGSIAYMVNTYENLGSFDTDGFETTFSQSLPTPVGTFKLSADWAYIWHFKMNGIGGLASTVDGAGNDLTLAQPFGGSFPRWKGNTDLSWNFHQWNADLEWQYTGPYSDALGLDYSTASYSVFNLNVAYTGFKHWTIYGGMNNIFNKAPPYDPLWVNQIDQTGYDQSLYTYMGRYLQVGATYKF
ncbi:MULTISPECIES: TonB-dependent receptor [Paraburkholderia]|jgi:iron complex outermembrane receptor protein|uniref:Iron complex outermembrane recepter protein n=1 Tax=Paraburkholderia phenazinium TaxID=60549 RepID=A0A1N6JW97_9BURK|nr:TonB-dependent receptor [Paraburkholderia phenazinium]SIO48523.1 iron complex outermembrane recepter protein [Paraburkholderia phenazinium]